MQGHASPLANGELHFNGEIDVKDAPADFLKVHIHGKATVEPESASPESIDSWIPVNHPGADRLPER